MNDINISDERIDEPIDLDKLDSDPNEAAKFQAILEAEHYRRNIMTLAEFEAKYVKLFRHEVTALPQDEYKELSQEYLYRIDPYYPVYIVKDRTSDRVSELLKTENVVYTLPAIFNRVGTVNNLGEDGLNIMLAFNNLASNASSDPFNKKKAEYSKYLSLVFNAMTDKEVHQVNCEHARELADKALQQSGEYKKTSGAVSSVEVQDLPSDMLEDLHTATNISNEKVTMSEEEEYL